ncbi:hypothetical protein IVB57_07490 [Bradyrhizobium sp. CW9]|uniref:hypothetical protein n=1 Tax=Bradyrhizobium sp. CW9 TaxID=2782689 RepID=UPI001FFC28E5|nr:hypothetical protein [Bradyrhizobium sp. CW9]MCK1328237.1 hypothetical protein [Bradyrhizobium sp. CW9]
MNGARALVRGLLLATGLAGLLWAAAAIPSFSEMALVGDAVARIIVDDRFKPGALADTLARIKTERGIGPSQPELLRARALIQLRLAEEAMARQSSEEADRRIAVALQDVRSAIADEPGDSFLWLMLYSVETNRSGFDPQYIRYLGQSYVAGPHEGWISLRRNRLALGVFEMLDEKNRLAAILEFEEMVDADFIENAALNMIGVGWKHREQLLAALGKADIVSRQSLNKRLAADGIKLPIPGIPLDERPWR